MANRRRTSIARPAPYQGQRQLNSVRPTMAEPYARYARGCDRVLEFLKISQPHTDDGYIALALSTCLAGLAGRRCATLACTMRAPNLPTWGGAALPIFCPLASIQYPMFHSSLLDGMVIALEVAATLAFAVSGLLEAARKRLDPVGVCVVAGLAAFGGGTLRDVLLDRRPFFWVAHATWLWVLIGVCIGAMVWLKTRHVALTHRAMQWPDALGLGLFSASGTQLATAQGMPAIVAVLMGVITAVFGGVLRDIVCNEIPSAFTDHKPYAVCAFAGGWTLLGLQFFHVPDEWALVFAAAAASSLRLGAMLTDFRLPAWSADQDLGR